jgi:HEAT repeat protein
MGFNTMIFYCPNCWSELSDGQRLCARCHQEVACWDEKTFEAKLLQSLSHPEPMTQMRAVYLLGEKKATQAVGALADVFRRTANPFLKSEVVEAVAKIGGESGRSFLIEALQDPSFIVRGEAVKAMGKFSGRAAEQALEKGLKDPSSYVREAARKAMDRLGSANQTNG